MNSSDAIVVGAGQAGLAAARSLLARGLNPVVSEAGPEPVGSWPRYYDSLVLFSPARYSALPGLPFPGDPDHYPHRDEVVDYLRRYAATLDADIRTDQRVTDVHPDGDGFAVHTPTTTSTAPLLIAASGGFGTPHRPDLPGLHTFTGHVLHAADYRSPQPFAGQRVVVVGARNSAVQIALELARHAHVTLASRAPIRYAPQRLLGRDVHFWSAVLGYDRLPIGHLLRTEPGIPVVDDGTYRPAIDVGRPARRPMFTHVDGDQVIWPDGRHEHVDTILLATGYRPALDHLTPLGALDATGSPRHSRGLSCTHPGLGYVGLEWQRSFASATLRGVGRDADHVTTRLWRRTSGSNRCCARAAAAA
ncbi:MAG TPA: NAD(P)/FAD-dependent oxidoreductase [Pseudonocardia sp.]|uniref:flavin-containing monooxygenase n=1 Tax=Pseudonocardia sp. TaxID=60912 RepID=UPI002B4B2FBE|nr:NAD(P)/FAD-dependent oxidoreductase [Pseudonocardia sp.]HLU55792.1 NAD(P)/FAD-dependent oxidoreductase [Pseudonocardia sp.]